MSNQPPEDFESKRSRLELPLCAAREAIEQEQVQAAIARVWNALMQRPAWLERQARALEKYPHNVKRTRNLGRRGERMEAFLRRRPSRARAEKEFLKALAAIPDKRAAALASRRDDPIDSLQVALAAVAPNSNPRLYARVWFEFRCDRDRDDVFDAWVPDGDNRRAHPGTLLDICRRCEGDPDLADDKELYRTVKRLVGRWVAMERYWFARSVDGWLRRFVYDACIHITHHASTAREAEDRLLALENWIFEVTDERLSPSEIFRELRQLARERGPAG